VIIICITILSGCFYLSRAVMTALNYFSTEKQPITRQVIAIIKYLYYFFLFTWGLGESNQQLSVMSHFQIIGVQGLKIEHSNLLLQLVFYYCV